MKTKYINWLWLQVKYTVKNPLMWMLLVLILGVGILLQTIQYSESDDIEVLLCSEGAESGGRLVDSLTKSSYDGFRFSTCEDVETLKMQVMAGNVKCGIVFPEDLDERVEKGTTSGSIRVYSRPESMDVEVVEELLAEQLFRLESDTLLRRYLEENNIDKEAIKRIRERNQEKLKTFTLSVFSVVKVDTPTAKQRTSVDHKWGFVLWLLLLSALLSVCEWDRSDFSAVYQAFPLGKRAILKTMQAFIQPLFLTAAVGGILFPLSMGKLLIFSLSASVWAMVLRLLCRRLKIYETAIPVVMMVTLFLNPILYDFAEVISAITWIRRFFPFVMA